MAEKSIKFSLKVDFYINRTIGEGISDAKRVVFHTRVKTLKYLVGFHITVDVK